MRNENPSNTYQPKRTRGSSRFAGAAVTKYLLIALAALFLVDILGMGEKSGRLMPYFALGDGVLHEVWRWLLYPFVDIKIGSWLFSLVIFFVFGGMVEQRVGSRRFTVMSIITTLVGASVYALMHGSSLFPLTGASGLALAVLVSMAMMFPEQQVRLMIPPISLKLKTLVTFMIGLMVVMAIAQRADPAISLAHLSGAGVSFLCMKNLHWLDIFKNLREKKTVRSSTRQKNSVKKRHQAGMKPRTNLNMSVSKLEAEVNRILDKVSAEGIGNLTEEEREILKFVSKKND
jgi:membrane associated rhomboid family serine protease